MDIVTILDDDDDDNLLFCDLCPLKTHSIQYLKNHKRFKHDEEGMIHRCDVCDQVFTFKNALIEHKKQMHEKHIWHGAAC